MKKWKTGLIVSTIALAVVAVATIPSVIAIVNMHKKNGTLVGDSTTNGATSTNFAFYLPSSVPGKQIGYNSIDDVINEIFNNKGTYVTNKSWVGDFDSAINAFTNEVIDFKNLRIYDNTRVGYAYKTANNSYVDNPSDAVRSYLTNLSRRYLDLNGMLWPTYAQAKEENDKYAINETMPVSFYKITDVANNNKEIKINPLSQEDIDFFKKRAIANLDYPTSGFSIDRVINTEFGATDYSEIVSSGDAQARIDAVFEILNLLCEYQQKMSYNITATLSNRGEVPVENRWVIDFNNSELECYGEAPSQWKNTPESPKIGSQNHLKSKVTFKIQKVDENGNKTIEDKIDIKGLSASQTENHLDILTNPNTFSSSVKKEAHYHDFASDGSLKDQYWIEVWQRRAPNLVPKFEYTGNYVYTDWRSLSHYGSTDVPRKIYNYNAYWMKDTIHWRAQHGDDYYNLFTNGEKVQKKDENGNLVNDENGEPVMVFQPDYNIVCDDMLLTDNVYWAYQAFIMNKPSSVWSTGDFAIEPITFNVNVTADKYELDKNKNEFIDRLTTIIMKTLIYRNDKILNNIESNEVLNQIRYQVQQIAEEFFDVFWNAIKKQFFTYNANGSASEDASLNYGDLRKSYFNLAKTNTMERKNVLIDSRIGEVKWIKSIFDSNVFYDLFDATSGITDTISSKYRSSGLIISFNGVPVFLIPDATFLSNTIVDDSMTKIKRLLKEWAQNSRTFDPSKLINISNNIDFSSSIEIFTIPDESENITKVDTNYSNIYNPKLKRYLNDGVFTDDELKENQSLILDFAANTELFRNDAGVESAIYLYNKNISKVTTKPNAQLYISEISDSDIFNGEPLRLYEKTNYSNDKNFLEHPLPVYYGETRAKLGTFNPAVNNRFVAVYKTQLDEIITEWEPEEVPIVIINGTEYKLALLANPNATQITGDPDILLQNAVRNLVSKIQKDNNYLFYMEDDGVKTLIENDVKSLYTCNLDIGILSDSIFNGKTSFSFLSRDDALAYLRSQIEKSRIFK